MNSDQESTYISTQMPDLCLETFGLAEKGISSICNPFVHKEFTVAPEQYCNLFRARMGRSVREGSSESCASGEVWQDQLKLARVLHQEVQEPRVLLCWSGVLKSKDLFRAKTFTLSFFTTRNASAATPPLQRRTSPRRATATGNVRATRPRSAEAAGG